MDNKVTKNRVSVHLEYDWLKYLAIIAAAIFLWSLIFTMTKPRFKLYEEIKFMHFRDADFYDNSPAKDGMLEDMQAYFTAKAGGGDGAEPVIKNVFWESLNPNDTNEAQVVMTRLMADYYDFLVCEAESEFAPEEPDPGTRWRSSTIDFGKWNTPGFSYEEFGAGAGFADETEFEAAKFYTNDDGVQAFRGFKLNGLPGIGRLFPALGPDTEKTYVISVLVTGGNIGNLNKYQKKYDAYQYNETYDALKFFLKRYNTN